MSSGSEGGPVVRFDVWVRSPPLSVRGRFRMRRRVLLLTAMVLVAMGLLLAMPARPAAAHAVLQSTTPADSAVLEAAPPEVVLTFSEPVSTTEEGVRAFDAGGAQVDAGDLVTEGSVLRLALRDGLGDGAYIVTYRVISQDAHPITGAFAFTVGDAAAAPDDDTIAGLLGDEDDRAWDIAGGFARALGYGGTLLAAGIGAFLVLAHDGGPEATRLRRWLLVSAGVGSLGVLATVPIQAARATGLGLGAILERGVATEILQDGVGLSLIVVQLGLGLLLLDNGRRRAPTVIGAGVATAGFALSGHTTTADPRWLVTLSDAAHVMAGAIWLGGLVALVAVLRARRDDPAAAGPVVGRFSAMAAIALGAVAAGGTLVGWREVRALSALTSTTYGQVLLAKVAVVAVVALIGAWNRFRLVPALTSAPRRAGALLRRTVRLEAGMLLAAVALTAALVNITPAATAAGVGSIFSDTVTLGDGSVNVVVDPNRAGTNEIHLYVFDADGRVSGDDFSEINVRLSLPSAEIGPLERRPFLAGPGHYQLNGSDLLIAGDWTIEVIARTGFDQVTAEVTVPVSP